ncbi:hypothetical protein BDF14DRAFT_251840, partial [Spinellus fusiger]
MFIVNSLIWCTKFIFIFAPIIFDESVWCFVTRYSLDNRIQNNLFQFFYSFWIYMYVLFYLQELPSEDLSLTVYHLPLFCFLS